MLASDHAVWRIWGPLNERQKQLSAAVNHLQRGNLEAAESALGPLIQRYANDADVQQLTGLLRKRQGRLAEAAEWLKKNLKQKPGAASHANFANVLMLSGLSADAALHYRHALDFDPGFRPALLGLARLAVREGRFEQGIGHLRTLGKKTGMDPELDVVWAQADSGRGDYQSALVRLDAALRRKPDYLNAALTRADCLLASGDWEGAIGAFESLLVSQAAEQSTAGIARALLAGGKSEAAAKMLGTALQQYPGSVDLHILNAKLRYMRGESGFAENLERAIANDPGNGALTLALTRIYRGADRHSDALSVLQSARKQSAAALQAPFALETASTHLEIGEFASALAFAREAHQLAPEVEAYRSELAQCLLSVGDATEAMNHIRGLQTAQPDNQRYIAYFADACRILGDKQAEALLNCRTRVRRYRLPVPDGWSTVDEFLADLRAVLEARHQFDRAPLDQSLRGGTQTQASLRNDTAPEIVALLGGLDTCIQQYRDDLGDDAGDVVARRNTGGHRMSGCWSVRLRDGGFHVNHLHPEGWISSAFYVAVPGAVRSDDPERKGWLQFGAPRFSQPGAEPLHHECPEPGVLVLFPSYMWHGTVPFQSAEIRMSVAFDVVPVQR